MNESFVLRFSTATRPLEVLDFRGDLGIVFDSHPHASPLNFGLGLRPRQPQRLDPVRQRHDWQPGEFKLDAARHGGGIRFSGFQGDASGLPPTIYDLAVEVESYQFEDSRTTLEIPEGGQVEVTLRETPSQRRVKVSGNIDPLTADLLDDARSMLDGQPVRQWLESAAARESRKACLLNILAKLRVPPAPAAGMTTPLTALFDYVYFADVDRVYGSAQPGLNNMLEQLTAAKAWVKEGKPKARIHRRLLDSLTRLGVASADADRFSLTSFRQGRGKNSLQIVVAAPPPGFNDPALYGDIDIDLGNPLWDLEGVLVHLGELLDPGKTDHIALHDKLDQGDTKDFLYYDPVQTQGVPG